MNLELCVDFGLFVLIWIVQVIIYPGFEAIDQRKFLSWHASYSRRISTIVMPLMIMQVYLHVESALERIGVFSVLQLALIGVCWIVTFSKAVPIHALMGKHGNTKNYVFKLIYWNKYRTIAWTMVFLMSIYLSAKVAI